MKNIFLRIALLVGIFGMLLFAGKRGVQAADYKVELTPNGIGRDVVGGLRIKGIAYSVDGALKESTYDVYKNATKSYERTWINGIEGENLTNADDASAFITVNSRSNSSRYQVHSARLRASLGDFSVVTHELVSQANDLNCQKGYSFMNYSNTGFLGRLMCANELSLGDCTYEGRSYIFNFYRPRELNAQTEVAVQAGEGRLVNGGKAYYTEDGYYIRELPVTSLEKPGHSVHFQGWYDAREGGKQISANTWCPSGTTLYARWEVIPLSYDVTCYDICGNTPAGKVLGEHVWKERYGTTVGGRTLGESSEMGAYYQGYAYKGDTTAVVSASGATVYRYFSEHHYRISFHGNGATGGNMATIENCAYTRQVTLTKNCFQKEFCVTLDGNGENAVCNTEKLYVRRAFLGWSLSPDGRVAFSDGASVSGLADRQGQVTLYAVWSDEKLSVEEKPRRFGYEFAGWAVAPDGQSGSTQFSVEGDMTLYAVWKPGIVSYHVEYYKEDLEGHYDLISSYVHQDYVDKEVVISAEDNTFLGYFLDKHASVLSGKVRADGSLVLTAFYTRNRNEVSYDLNGGENAVLPETVSRKYGEELVIWEETNLKKPGYTFGGWNQEGDGKNRTYKPGETIKMPNHSVVLYAVWVPISYEIRFDGNGAEGGEGIPGSILADYDEAVRLPICQGEKPGYEFAGWNTAADGSGSSYSCQEEVAMLCSKEGESILLFAQWHPISFEISYDANVNEDEMGLVKGKVENTPYSYVDESFAAREIYYRAGYQFMGWNTKADGTGKMFASGQNITGQITSKKERVFYAIWKAGENIGFQVEIMLEGTQEPLDTVQFYGKTGEKVADALRRACSEILSGEDVAYFYPGYQVINVEELNRVIQGDHSTKCHVSVKRRTCTLNYSAYQQGMLVSLLEERGYLYRDKAVLKRQLAYFGKDVSVCRYVDRDGNSYIPGESISLERNLTLVPQFKVTLHDGEGKKEEEYCCLGKAYTLPLLERKGYRFLGWCTQDGNTVGAGKEEITSVEDMDIYPSWSEPLHYQISYDVEERAIKILEGKVSQYQYLSEVSLPNKNQVAVLLDEYEFAGWYLAGDEEQKLVDRLPSGICGDVVLKAALVKKNVIGSGSGDGQNEDDTQKIPSDGQGGSSGGDHENPGQSGADGSGNKNPGQSGTGGSGNKNPGQSGTGDQNTADPGQSGGLVKNPDILSQKRNPSQSLIQKKAEGKVKIGRIFWKNKLKYKITSLKKGKVTVKVVGNRYKKKQLRIPSKVSYQGKKFRVTVVGKKAFRGNKYIRKMRVPSTVHTVGTQAFAHMKKLTHLAFGRNLKSLGGKACYQDASLRKVKINSHKLKRMGRKAFQGCIRLRPVF